MLIGLCAIVCNQPIVVAEAGFVESGIHVRQTRWLGKAVHIVHHSTGSRLQLKPSQTGLEFTTNPDDRTTPADAVESILELNNPTLSA